MLACAPHEPMLVILYALLEYTPFSQVASCTMSTERKAGWVTNFPTHHVMGCPWERGVCRSSHRRRYLRRISTCCSSAIGCLPCDFRRDLHIDTRGCPTAMLTRKFRCRCPGNPLTEKLPVDRGNHCQHEPKPLERSGGGPFWTI